MIFLTSGILRFYFLRIKNICSQPGIQKEEQAITNLWYKKWSLSRTGSTRYRML